MNNSGSDSWWGIKKPISQLFLSFLILVITSIEAVLAPPPPPSSPLSPSPLSSPSSSSSKSSKSSKPQDVVVILVCAAVGVLIIVVVILSLRKLRKRSATAGLPYISKNGVIGVSVAGANLQSELEVVSLSCDSISLATISSTLSSARHHSLSSSRHHSLSSSRHHSLSSSSMRRYSSPPMRSPLRYFSSARRFSYTQTSEREPTPPPSSSVSTSPKITPLEDIASPQPGADENWPASTNHSLLSVSSHAASESSPSYNEILKDAPPPPYKKYME